MLAEQLLVNAAVLGAVLTLFALGLSLTWGALDVLNLAHGAIFVASAWVASKLAATVDVPFVVLVLAGMAAGAFLAVIAELLAFRPIRRLISNKRQAELSMVAATVGFGFIIDNLVGRATSHQVFSFPLGAFEFRKYDLLIATAFNIEIIIFAAAVVGAVALNYWIMRTRQGMAIRAIAFSPRIAPLLGVKVDNMAALTMAVSGALAGLSGTLMVVWTSGMDISTGHSLLLRAFAIVVLGGVGSVKGCVLAAFLLAIVETGIVAAGYGSLRDAAAFSLIILVLLFRPQGLFGTGRAMRA